MTMTLPLEVEQVHADCGHVVFASVPPMGYTAVFKTASLPASTLQDIQVHCSIGAGNHSDIWPNLRAITLRDGTLVLAFSFPLSTPDEFGRGGLGYTHAMLFSRQRITQLLRERPGVLHDYIHVLYDRKETDVTGTAALIANAAAECTREFTDPRANPHLRELAILLRVLSPWATTPRDAEPGPRFFFGRNAPARPGVLKRIRKAIRQGKRIVLVGPPSAWDFNHIIDHAIVAFLELRREFFVSTGSLTSDEPVDLVYAGPHAPDVQVPGDTEIVTYT